MNIPDLKLKQDVPTRWNSTRDMIERVVKLKDAVISTLALENPELNTIDPTEWLTLTMLIEVFQIFKDITEEVNAEKNVTVSKILLFVFIAYQHINHYCAKQDLSNDVKLVVQGFSVRIMIYLQRLQYLILASNNMGLKTKVNIMRQFNDSEDN